MYLYVWWMCMRAFRDGYAVLVLYYINMNMITQGANFRFWVYIHGCDCVCAEFGL